MMKKFTGYLTEIRSQSGSGLAQTVWREHRDRAKPGKRVVAFIESGFGLRQLHAALGADTRAFDTLCTILFSDWSPAPLIESIEVVEEEE